MDAALPDYRSLDDDLADRSWEELLTLRSRLTKLKHQIETQLGIRRKAGWMSDEDWRNHVTWRAGAIAKLEHVRADLAKVKDEVSRRVRLGLVPKTGGAGGRTKVELYPLLLRLVLAIADWPEAPLLVRSAADEMAEALGNVLAAQAGEEQPADLHAEEGQR